MIFIKKILKEIKMMLSFWRKSLVYQPVNTPAFYTEDGNYLQFQIEYFKNKSEKILLIGQVDLYFLGRLGQIGDESEEDYLESVYQNISDTLAEIAIKQFINTPTEFPINILGHPVIYISKEALLAHDIFVD